MRGPSGLSVVVPVYRSEPILPELVQTAWKTVLSRVTSNYELVLVNDSSPDQSWDVICQAGRSQSLDSSHQPDAQLRPAQCAAVRHPRVAI